MDFFWGALVLYSLYLIVKKGDSIEKRLIRIENYHYGGNVAQKSNIPILNSLLNRRPNEYPKLAMSYSKNF